MPGEGEDTRYRAMSVYQHIHGHRYEINPDVTKTQPEGRCVVRGQSAASLAAEHDDGGLGAGPGQVADRSYHRPGSPRHPPGLPGSTISHKYDNGAWPDAVGATSPALAMLLQRRATRR